jgi:hypothetical protein
MYSMEPQHFRGGVWASSALTNYDNACVTYETTMLAQHRVQRCTWWHLASHVFFHACFFPELYSKKHAYRVVHPASRPHKSVHRLCLLNYCIPHLGAA